jgi:hypothetical protein
MVSTRDVGPTARHGIGSFRYLILVLLTPQLCMLIAISHSGIGTPALWLGGAGIMALLLWSGLGWYRQFTARAVA